MSSTQQVRPSPVEKVALFPPDVSTRELSLIYCQRLLAVCASSIAYLRNVLPEDSFGVRKWNGMPLRILKGSNKQSLLLINYLAGAFDALDKTYLRQIMLGICPNPANLDDVVECYNFHVTYSNDGSAGMHVEGETVANEKRMYEQATTDTADLLRKLFFFVENLSTLPKDCAFTMKILYYDERTPADYEPPGFQPTNEPDFLFTGNKKPVSVKLGQLRTGFMGMKAFVKTVMNGNETEEEEVGVCEEENAAKSNKNTNANLVRRYSAAFVTPKAPSRDMVARQRGKRAPAENYAESSGNENEIPVAKKKANCKR